MSDVTEIAKGLGIWERHAILTPGPYVRPGNGGIGKKLRMKGLTVAHYTSAAISKPKLTPLGLAVREHLESSKGQGLNTCRAGK